MRAAAQILAALAAALTTAHVADDYKPVGAVSTEKTQQPTGVMVEESTEHEGLADDDPLYFASPVEGQPTAERQPRRVSDFRSKALDPFDYTEQKLCSPSSPDGFSPPIQRTQHKDIDYIRNLWIRVAALEKPAADDGSRESGESQESFASLQSSAPVLHPADRDRLALVQTPSGGTQIVELEGPAKVSTRPTTVAPTGEPWTTTGGEVVYSEGGDRDFSKEPVKETPVGQDVIEPAPVTAPPVSQPVVSVAPIVVQPRQEVSRARVCICGQCYLRVQYSDGTTELKPSGSRAARRVRLFRRW